VGVLIKRIGVQQICVWCIASTVTIVIMIAILLVHDASRAYSSTNEARLEWRANGALCPRLRASERRQSRPLVRIENCQPNACFSCGFSFNNGVVIFSSSFVSPRVHPRFSGFAPRCTLDDRFDRRGRRAPAWWRCSSSFRSRRRSSGTWSRGCR